VTLVLLLFAIGRRENRDASSPGDVIVAFKSLEVSSGLPLLT
jgi:hypothetical protein